MRKLNFVLHINAMCFSLQFSLRLTQDSCCCKVSSFFLHKNLKMKSVFIVSIIYFRIIFAEVYLRCSPREFASLRFPEKTREGMKFVNRCEHFVFKYRKFD